MFAPVSNSWLSTLLEPSLSDHCTPTSPFLKSFSAYSHLCIPTPQAFISSLFGTLSIISWLFAQLPQIIRNYKNQSTAGLSLFFLIEWNLGDISNFFGAILTNQAVWQITIGAYYVFVDVALVLQWIWYERLKHGRPLRRIKLISSKSQRDGSDGDPHLVEPHTLRTRPSRDEVESDVFPGPDSAAPQDIPTSKSTYAHNMFSTPVYGTISPSTSLATSPATRTIHRIQRQSLPTASPRTTLFITLMVALASARASPMSTAADIANKSAVIFDLGTILSWTSTTLYLLSRIPQLLMNYQRKSTSGLSPKMFAAAFMGNLFYSSSLACNPCAWQSFGPYGGHGWADQGGSDRAKWLAAALPFFLGAAGVLALDGAVGLQFWLYGKGPRGEDSMLVIQEERPESGTGGKSIRITKVTGWMRGWQPTARGKITPVVIVRRAAEAERRPLLGEPPEGARGGVERYT